MRSPRLSSTLLPPLALALGAASNLFFGTESWGKTSPTFSLNPEAVFYYNWQPALLLHSDLAQAGTANEVVPTKTGSGAIIADIQVRFLDKKNQLTKGLTRDFIIKREFELQPGDVYDQKLAQQGLERVLELDIVKKASLTLEPTTNPNQVVMVVNVVERSSFTVNFDLDTSLPSALRGPFQLREVAPGQSEDTGLAASGSLQLRNLGGNDQNLVLRLRGGDGVLDTELSFTDPWIAGDSHRTGYAVNVFNQRAIESVFTGGDRDVNLPGGKGTPWVHRLGGGVEFFRPITPEFKAALGLSIERVSVRDGMFTSDIEPEDELGNSLTVSDTGQDDLLTLNFSADLDQRNDSESPTGGYRLLFGINQSIPVGDANILFTRLKANYLQYIPFPLFGFTDGPRTLVLTLQGGTILGDVPPYEAFNLDSDPVRGFGGVELGTGSSFILAAAEYRFPIATFSLFNKQINLGGALFMGYASDLGTGEDVIGKPAVVREKPGDGLGYGLGLRAGTPLGLVRFEFGLNDRGDSQAVVTIGDRF